MSSFRASPSPSAVPTVSFPMTMNQSISTVLRGQVNSTEQKFNMDSIPFPDTATQIRHIAEFMIMFGIVGLIFLALSLKVTALIKEKCNKEKLHILSPFMWIKNKYNEWAKKGDILPVFRPKKAKESPFVGPIQTPPLLPSCPRLDGAEKGQNIMFRFRGPNNAKIDSEATTGDNETRITIVTIVENGGKPPLVPKVQPA